MGAEMLDAVNAGANSLEFFHGHLGCPDVRYHSRR